MADLDIAAGWAAENGGLEAADMRRSLQGKLQNPKSKLQENFKIQPRKLSGQENLKIQTQSSKVS